MIVVDAAVLGVSLAQHVQNGKKTASPWPLGVGDVESNFSWFLVMWNVEIFVVTTCSYTLIDHCMAWNS